MKHRQSRVKELILRELGAIISREVSFAAQLVTVQDVDLTPDFKNCHVHVGVLGTSDQRRDAMHKLHEMRPMLQHEMAKRVILKFTPHLHFHLDQALERGTKVMEVLRQIDEVSPEPKEDDDDYDHDQGHDEPSDEENKPR
jgi:ribosome-binding factor A